MFLEAQLLYDYGIPVRPTRKLNVTFKIKIKRRNLNEFSHFFSTLNKQFYKFFRSSYFMKRISHHKNVIDVLFMDIIILV